MLRSYRVFQRRLWPSIVLTIDARNWTKETYVYVILSPELAQLIATIPHAMYVVKLQIYIVEKCVLPYHRSR